MLNRKHFSSFYWYEQWLYSRTSLFYKNGGNISTATLRSPGTCFRSPWVPFAIQPLPLIPSKVWFSPQVISFTFTGLTTIHIHSTSWYTSDAVYLNYIWRSVGQFYLTVSQILCGQNQTHPPPWSLILYCRWWHHYFTFSPRYGLFHLHTSHQSPTPANFSSETILNSVSSPFLYLASYQNHLGSYKKIPKPRAHLRPFKSGLRHQCLLKASQVTPISSQARESDLVLGVCQPPLSPFQALQSPLTRRNGLSSHLSFCTHAVSCPYHTLHHPTLQSGYSYLS